MKALRSFAVRASLPEPLAALPTIAANLRWTWDPRAVDLFRWVDSDAWDSSGHDPVRMLGLVSRERLDELAEDGPFLTFLSSVSEDLQSYLIEPRWYQTHSEGAKVANIAYFSPEFGVGEALPVYSGGLGVLAGDHLKAASDLGLPLVAIGLLYRQGYFRQQLSGDGWQQETYPDLDPHAMPLVLQGDERPIKIEVDLAGKSCIAQIWRAQVGRVPLFLLDSDVEENAPEERGITDRLYAGASEHRLRQEILLGIGGVRALAALGYDVNVFHSNEGHAGFLGLERIRNLVGEHGLSFDEALEAVRASTVFTTHTPVPAGIDRFDLDLMERYFESFAKECGVTFGELIEVGREPGTSEKDAPPAFNMAMMGFRLAGYSNGVSKLHGNVARLMFAPLWPEIPVDEVPIDSITNGVHTPTWLGPEMTEVLNRRLTPGWAETGAARWERIREVTDAELWRARERARERLVYFVRERMRAQLLARGASISELGWTEEVFDPSILTIGFARRFAMYKRGTLLLRDRDRLVEILTSQDKPVQIVIAGKAHPRDDGGKNLVRQLVHFSSDPALRNRIAFVEDYDMEVARYLTQGADVWLNNPRRPQEACGTSGMKAALNGALNCSVLDGWWDECYDGSNGWAIGGRTVHPDDDYQDKLDASALYSLIERDITPRFYDRPEGPIPRRWIERVKASLESTAKFVTADRMVRDYIRLFYEPAAANWEELSAGDFDGARGLASWKSRVRDAWPALEVIAVEGDEKPVGVGESRSVVATVRLGDLDVDDVTMQLAHGSVGANGELIDPQIVAMEPRDARDGVHTFEGHFAARSAGLYGFAVRVIPSHDSLPNPMDIGLIAWAQRTQDGRT